MTTTAKFAVEAATHRKQWGRDAAQKFARNNGVSLRLYRIACQCEAVKNFN